jgi:polar amino acid transport system substrate-binding protein
VSTRLTRSLLSLMLVAFGAAASSCGIPHDPENSVERIRESGVLRAGFTVHEPWVTEGTDTPGGPEAEIVSQLAGSLGARVEWRQGSESELFEALERFELDVVIGGLTADNPAGPGLALTRGYVEHDKKQHVIAAAPGENRLLVALEAAARAHAPSVAARVGGKVVE